MGRLSLAIDSLPVGMRHIIHGIWSAESPLSCLHSSIAALESRT